MRASCGHIAAAIKTNGVIIPQRRCVTFIVDGKALNQEWRALPSF